MPASTRDSIARLPVYALAEQDVPGVERVIQLGQNELGIAPSRLAIEAAAGALGALNRYPDPDHRRLRLAIAETHGLRPERIACGAGSMELMGLLATAHWPPVPVRRAAASGVSARLVHDRASAFSCRVAPDRIGLAPNVVAGGGVPTVGGYTARADRHRVNSSAPRCPVSAPRAV